ncbi:MAG: hypothetical protein U0169_01170 [Polyangiaceae bacterium]
MDPVDEADDSDSVRNLRIADLVDVEAMLRDSEPQNDAVKDTLPPQSGVTQVRGDVPEAPPSRTAVSTRR